MVVQGGIVGHSANETLKNCYNTGNIYGATAGGISGYSGAIESCFNTGNISGRNYAAGIVAKSGNGDIINCYNIGTISGDEAAGICVNINGNMSTNAKTINNCYNIGKVDATTVGAGIARLENAYYYITNCYNMGDIKSSKGYVVGIAWCGNYHRPILVSCYNVGTLSAIKKIFGITNGATVYNCYYLSTCGVTTIDNNSKTADEMKRLTNQLNKAYTINEEDKTVTISDSEVTNVWTSDTSNINDGYPILSWQTKP